MISLSFPTLGHNSIGTKTMQPSSMYSLYQHSRKLIPAQS